MGHLESRTIWGLRLDGDLERLWWKLFIHVNFTRTTLASGHFGLSVTTVCGQDDDILCIQLSQSSSGGDQRLGNTQVSSQRSHRTPGPKSPARRPTHRSTPTRSQAGDLVGEYGVQASATDLEALPLGPNPPPGDSALGYAIRYSPPRSESKGPVERPSSSDTSHSALLATKGLVQQSPVDRPVLSEHVPVTPGPGKPGTGHLIK